MPAITSLQCNYVKWRRSGCTVNKVWAAAWWGLWKPAPALTGGGFVDFLYEPFELKAAVVGLNIGDISALNWILDFPLAAQEEICSLGLPMSHYFYKNTTFKHE